MNVPICGDWHKEERRPNITLHADVAFALCTFAWEVSISAPSRHEAFVVVVDLFAALVLLPEDDKCRKVNKQEIRDSLCCHNTVLSASYLTAPLSAGPAEQPAVRFHHPLTSRHPDRKETKTLIVTQRNDFVSLKLGFSKRGPGATSGPWATPSGPRGDT